MGMHDLAAAHALEARRDQRDEKNDDQWDAAGGKKVA